MVWNTFQQRLRLLWVFTTMDGLVFALKTQPKPTFPPLPHPTFFVCQALLGVITYTFASLCIVLRQPHYDNRIFFKNTNSFKLWCRQGSTPARGVARRC